MLGEELAVSYTRWLSLFGYVAVKVGLEFTQNVWFYSNNISLGVVNLRMMHNSVWGEGQSRMHAVLRMPLFTHARVCVWHNLWGPFCKYFMFDKGRGREQVQKEAIKGGRKEHFQGSLAFIPSCACVLVVFGQPLSPRCVCVPLCRRCLLITAEPTTDCTYLA